jgi:hypothetical protein
MRDGTPNGYAIATFEGRDYTLRYKAARRPADYQMNIYAPASVGHGESADTEILVNVFAGSQRSRVELRLSRSGKSAGSSADEWIELERVERLDPAYVALRARELALLGEKLTLPMPVASSHIWSGHLPNAPAPGSYWIEVRSSDMFGQIDIGRRLIRIE